MPALIPVPADAGKNVEFFDLLHGSSGGDARSGDEAAAF